MSILRFKIRDCKSFQSLQGRFCHVSSPGGKIMAIGGAARNLLAQTLRLNFAPTVNDYDFTVIGGTSFTIDKSPKKKNRVEVEKESTSHGTLSSYMESRDLTVNQVAIDSQGNLFATKRAISSMKNGTIDFVSNCPTQREAVRACRFAIEYNFKLSPKARKIVKGFTLSSFQEEDCYWRYTSSGYNLEEFYNSL